MTPNTNADALKDFKTAVSFFWSSGEKEQARLLEAEAKKKGQHIGSCYTEEILDKLITVNPIMLELKNDVRLLEGVDDPVLIRGETGTGKELIAQALHGSRAGKFVAVNCPAISVDLMMSEFFGHVKGAYTGAVNDRVGKFQAASNGTLFIDEVGDMPPTMQAALLRVLQEGVICRVGTNEEIKVNPRIVCATNKDLEGMVTNGHFRLDLLQRLDVISLWTVPLRSRSNDIPRIINHWELLDGAKPGKFPLEKLITTRLLGNVRELWGIYRRWKVLGKIANYGD